MSESEISRRYCIRANEVAGYHPANHTGTLHRRLIGPETVGATQGDLCAPLWRIAGQSD